MNKLVIVAALTMLILGVLAAIPSSAGSTFTDDDHLLTRAEHERDPIYVRATQLD